MGYRNLRECIDDLERTEQLVRIEQEVDPHLEAAEIQRRVYAAGGPAIYFANVKDCRFPLVSNLFGTIERARFLFRDTLELVQRLVELKLDPASALQHPLSAARALPAAWAMRPKLVKRGPILAHNTTLRHLPQLVSWPDDGGPFVTLPAVYTEDVSRPGWQASNLGMYRIQLAGNQYEPDRQVGLHYQIHRGIGVHHSKAIESGQPFRVNIFIGGPPAMPLAAVMPLPEGLSELTFAGALGGRRVRLVTGQGPLPLLAEADFVITGTVDPERLLPEGPFGDHLGYYSLAHDFPVVNVERVYHREGAIWPFTVVGRPPQEDTAFGKLIHEITGAAIPQVLPGVKAVHAVDAAGVHPLLLAIGSERYTPYEPVSQADGSAVAPRPAELLTQANAILGQGQLSLAKFLLIVDGADDPALDIHDIPAFLQHLLERVDWTNDLHFQTRTTIDTLDYSGEGLNRGSKVVIAARGPRRRELPTEIPGDLSLPAGWRNARLCLPGMLAIEGPAFASIPDAQSIRDAFAVPTDHPLRAFSLLVLCDDSDFVAQSLKNFLWVTFTRANPARDLHGIDSFTEDKHWGCRGPLIIDARLKPHHAPPLIEDPEVTRRVDQLAAPGGPLHGIL
jgi:4-hydroxy-3-polyprenylbenzoate decarboxylase